MTPDHVNFSLLVPSYNRPEMIRETITSLLINSAPDVEIIVSDDASPKREAIRSALADFIAEGSVNYIQQTTNLRWSRNRNALLQAARGEYVVLLGDDDHLKPGAVDRLRRWTALYPNVAVFGVGYDVIDELGNRVCTYCTPQPVLYEITPNSPWEEIFSFDAVPMWSHHPFTMCSRRAVAIQVWYNENVDIADDLLYLYDVLERGFQFLAVPEVILEWRNSFTSRSSYANLSADLTRCYESLGLVLAELMNRPRLRSEVSNLIESPEYLQKFCRVPRSSLDHITSLLKRRPVNGSAVAECIRHHALRSTASTGEELRRHLRAARIMGIRHWLRVVCCLRDRILYKRCRALK
ncbi:MAG: glycosyltransferase family 2 protein [Verrucomicrobiia bacterium]